MLQLEGVEFVYLTGKMTAKEKITAIQTFRDNPTVKYLVRRLGSEGKEGRAEGRIRDANNQL